MRDKIVIGTRGSKLALYQANLVKSKLEEAYPSLEVIINIIKTKGDKILEFSKPKIKNIKEVNTDHILISPL